MTQQMGLFLPTIKGTKLSFIRSILSNQKKALKTKDVIMMSVPKYEELSVKNLYDDALRDQVLRDYLPDLSMNSNRLPERNFFFGVLGTIRNEYLKQIIEDANMKRYQQGEQQGNEDFIAIQENWYQELIKHPYISKKSGKAIFLIKQRSKLVRNKKMYHKFDLSQRLTQNNEEEKDYIESYGGNLKRQKIYDLQQNTLNQSEDSMNTMHLIFEIICLKSNYQMFSFLRAHVLFNKV